MAKVKHEGNTKPGSFSKKSSIRKHKKISAMFADRNWNRKSFSPSNQRKACNVKVEQESAKEEMEEKKKIDKGKGKEKSRKDHLLKGLLR